LFFKHRGIVTDFLLEEKQLVDYDETDDVNEFRDGCLIIKTIEAPMVRRGDTIEITIRDRNRKKRGSASNGKDGP
jgi:hypothetical protein